MPWINRIIISVAIIHLSVFAMVAFFCLGETGSLLIPLGIEIFALLCMLAPLIRLSWPTVHLALGAMVFGAFVAVVELKEAVYVPLRLGHIVLLLCVWAGVEPAVRGIFMLDRRKWEAVACMAGGFILFTATLGFGTQYAEQGADFYTTPEPEVVGELTKPEVMWIRGIVAARTHDPLRMIKVSSENEVEVWAGEFRGGAWRRGTIFYVKKEGCAWKFDEERQGCWTEGPSLEGLPEEGQGIEAVKEHVERSRARKPGTE